MQFENLMGRWGPLESTQWGHFGDTASLISPFPPSFQGRGLLKLRKEKVMNSQSPQSKGLSNEGMKESLPSRDKYWSEIDDKEKVERMRNVVQGLLERVETLERVNNRLIRHKHTKDERVITEEPMEFGDYGSQILGPNTYRTYGKDKDEVYF